MLAASLLALACGSTDAQVLASPSAALSTVGKGGDRAGAGGSAGRPDAGAGDVGGDGAAGSSSAGAGGTAAGGAAGAPSATCPFGPGITTVFATGQDGDLATTVAADETTIYWGALHLYAAPLDGSPTDRAPGFDGVSAIVVADGVPCFLGDRADGTAGLFAVSGGAPALLGAGSSAGPLATDGTRVYFAPNALHTVTSLLVDGTDPVAITTDGPIASAIAIHGDDVFVATSDGDGSTTALLERGSVAGGPTTTIATATTHVFFVAADDGGVYWAEEPDAGGTKAVIRRADRDGQNLATIDTLDAGGVVGLVVDETRVYYDRGDAIFAIAKSGGTATPLAPALHGARGLAQNASALFWVNEAGGTTSTPPPQNAIQATCK